MASDQNLHHVSKIGIIGAGISGIAAAKQLSAHSPVVFEATDSIGGVWKHCTYTSTKLQTPRCDFEFTDYPWPERDNSSFPSHIEILEYLHNYASHFDVLKYVKLNSKVVELRYVGNESESYLDPLEIEPRGYGRLLGGRPVWEVAVQTNQSPNLQCYAFECLVMCLGKYGDMPKMPNFPANKVEKYFKWYAFECLVMCLGKYGDMPKMPNFPANKGREIFQGKVLHSLDYSKLDEAAAHRLLKGKKVVVIGYKKSAIDLAMEAAEANQGPDGQQCTMVIRTLHWTVPSYWIWGLPFFLFYSTRSSQFLHERPDQSFLRTLLCFLLSPMRKAISKFIESYLAWKLPLVKYGLKPDHPFEEDYASCQMAILPENFFAEADKGRILFKRSSKWWFWSGGIELEDNTKLEADVVVLATGFDGNKKLKALLPQPFCSLIQDSSGNLPLYRGTIHPLIPNMAFLGYVESVSNLHTSELRSKWLAQLVDEQFKLPTIEKMLEKTRKEMQVMKRSTRFYERNCISTFSINHSDDLCEDMGWKSRRKNSWFSEAFAPYTCQDYNPSHP